MDQVPEYSYRSEDGLYQAVLPSWSRPDREVSFELTSPESDDDEISVRVEEVAEKPTRELLRTRALSPLRDQAVTQWEGTIDGRQAVRRTTTGKFRWLGEHLQAVDHTILVGLGDEANGYRVGRISQMAAATSPTAQRDLLSVVTPICSPPQPAPKGTVTLQLRGFGVSVSKDWRRHFSGMRGEQDFGPLQPSHWGDEEPAPGYKVSWSISGYTSDLEDSVRSTKIHWSVPFNEHGGLELPGQPPDGPALADYLGVEVPAVRYPTVPSLDIRGKDIQIEDSRSRLAHQRFIAWFRIGAFGGCAVAMSVERGSQDRAARMWTALMYCIHIQGSRS